MSIQMFLLIGGRQNFTLFLTCNGYGNGNGYGNVKVNADAGVSRIALPILRIVELKILETVDSIIMEKHCYQDRQL